MQIVCAIVSNLCYVLRETPENAEIIESIIFHESVDVTALFNNGNVILRFVQIYSAQSKRFNDYLFLL